MSIIRDILCAIGLHLCRGWQVTGKLYADRACTTRVGDIYTGYCINCGCPKIKKVRTGDKVRT